MMDLHDELLELCAGRAVGALDDADRGRLERHLDRGCVDCERALREFGDAAVELARSAGDIAPDPDLKPRVMEAIASQARPAPVRGRAVPIAPIRERRTASLSVAVSGWAAAAVLAVAGLVQLRTTGELNERLEAVRSANARLESRLQEERLWTASMASPAARVAIMEPTPDGSRRMGGWALYDPMTRRAVIVLEHLVLEPGHDYELWAIRSAGPRSLGVIGVDPSGRSFVRLPEVSDPHDLAAFAVSLEATGGSPDRTSPAGPVVLVGALGT